MVGDCAIVRTNEKAGASEVESYFLLQLGGSFREVVLPVNIGDLFWLRESLEFGKLICGSLSFEVSTVRGMVVGTLILFLLVVLSAVSCLICAIVRSCELN